MVNLSYQISENLEANLKEIDLLRTKILNLPILPNNELKFRWEANINKTYWGLTLADNPLTKTQMAKLMINQLPKKMSDSQKEVVAYINTLQFIRNNWKIDVIEIYDLSCKSVFGSSLSYFKTKEAGVKKILEFIESGKIHPVIQAGLIQIEIIKLSPFENGTGRVARLLSHQILNKYAYDLRGFLVLEDYYREDLISLKEALSSVEKYKNTTFWLEYFTNGVKLGMEKVFHSLTVAGSDLLAQTSPAMSKSGLWKLTERQNKILEKLENPNLKITNKDVQKMFDISQITSSRDLSKMAGLGILLPHGKGRSVFYTKA